MKKEIYSGSKKYVKNREEKNPEQTKTPSEQTKPTVKDWHDKQSPKQSNLIPQKK